MRKEWLLESSEGFWEAVWTDGDARTSWCEPGSQSRAGGEGRLASLCTQELEAAASPGTPCSWFFRAVFDVKTRLVAPKGIITREVALMLICGTVLILVDCLSFLWSWRIFLFCLAFQLQP